MFKKLLSGIMLTLVLVSVLTLASNFPHVKAPAAIAIKPNGSISPPTAPMTTLDNITYTLTGNVNFGSDTGISIERNDIILDGAGYTIQGIGIQYQRGISWWGIKNVTVKNTKIRAVGYGIQIQNSNNNSIIGNTITANRNEGFEFYNCSKSIINDNIITNNPSVIAMYLSYCSNNSISGNNITGNFDGICLTSSSYNNSISENTIANNSEGIRFYPPSCNNSISGNTFINNGIVLRGPLMNFAENNTVNGKPLIYLGGLTDYSVDDAGQVILVNCDRIKVENLNLSSATIGLQLWQTNNSDISGNYVAKNRIGIVLSSSSTNRIYGNNITANMDYGINLDSSSNSNSISGNNITNNGCGVCCAYASGASHNNSISGNNITGNYDGISLGYPASHIYSNNNRIYGNNITANINYGINIYPSNNSIIRENTIANNGGGIWLVDSINNTIYHNSFINNSLQFRSINSVNAWTDGYPEGGNYWSNYTGADLHMGSYQNETGTDGIGDTPYIIGGIGANNTDDYPLIKPWSSPDIAVMSIVKIKTVVCQGFASDINATVFNEGNKIEAFNVTVYADSTILETRSLMLANLTSAMLNFPFNTSGFAKGNYTIRVYAIPVESETHTSDNSLLDGWIVVSMVGDITSEATGYPDGRCDMSDVYVVCKRFGKFYPNPEYVPNYDIDNDGRIDMNDIYIVCKNFGKIDP